MKINRFKIFENVSDDKIRELLLEYNKIKVNLSDFMISCNFIDDKDITINDFWYPDHTSSTYFGVDYLDDEDEEVSYTFTKKEYDEFLIFLENPELYKSSKKYNL